MATQPAAKSEEEKIANILQTNLKLTKVHGVGICHMSIGLIGADDGEGNRPEADTGNG